VVILSNALKSATNRINKRLLKICQMPLSCSPLLPPSLPLPHVLEYGSPLRTPKKTAFNPSLSTKSRIPS